MFGVDFSQDNLSRYDVLSTPKIRGLSGKSEELRANRRFVVLCVVDVLTICSRYRLIHK